MASSERTPVGIVLFMCDQLSAKWLEVAPEGVAPTPNIDRLRRNGVTFTNAFTSNPICSPARATIATGLTTRCHGLLENGYQLDPTLPTFMHLLQRNAWRTGAFGKVHLHPHFAGLNPDYRPYGFQVTHITEDPRGGEWLDWVQQQYPKYYDNALATIRSPQIADFQAYGPRRVNLRQRIEQVQRDFQWATPEFPNNTSRAFTLPFPEQMSQTCWITTHALDFVRRTGPNESFFAHLGYVQPHSPFCPPAEYMQCVNPDKIPEPAGAEWLHDPHAPKCFHSRKAHLPHQWHHARHCYFADIVHLDRQLGRLFEALEQTGRLASTYIIFLADHGELLFDHGFTGKSERHYDACIRVPLIITGPSLSKGLVCDQIVQLEDICPTILDIAGLHPEPIAKMGPYLKADQTDIPVLPGRSLVDLCRRRQPAHWRQAAYCESYNCTGSFQPGYWARTIRTRDFRYTFYPGGNGEQLFDLRKDPHEQHNRVADPDYAPLRQQLRDQLMELMVMQDYPRTRRDLFALGVH